LRASMLCRWTRAAPAARSGVQLRVTAASKIRAAGGFSTYAFNTPEIYNTSRKELEGEWGNLGFSIRNMNGHVK
jgi:hypothetical protein